MELQNLLSINHHSEFFNAISERKSLALAKNQNLAWQKKQISDKLLTLFRMGGLFGQFFPCNFYKHRN